MASLRAVLRPVALAGPECFAVTVTRLLQILPASPTVVALPDLHFRLKSNATVFGDAIGDGTDQPLHVNSATAPVGQGEVRMSLGDRSAADAKPLEPRLVDQLAGGTPRGVPEDAAGTLDAEGRLRFLLE